MSRSPAQPLQGKTVLDVSRMVPGAIAARMLVDLGARVIKVEAPSVGDPLRWVLPLVDGVGAAFCGFYRGTESICLDLKQPADVEILCALAGHADVLLENFRPGTLDAWGAGPKRLLTLHPRLTVCSLPSFGSRGPGAGQVGHDINVVAWSGLLSVLPGEAVPPILIADVATGILACSAVLAALLGRERSGRGEWIEQPLATGPLPFLTLPMAERSAGGGGLTDTMLGGGSPAYRIYTCGDGLRLAVGALEPKFWASFVELLDLAHASGLGMDSGPQGREVARQVQEKLSGHPRAYWVARLEGQGLPIHPVHDSTAAIEVLTSSGLVEPTPTPAGGTLATPGPYLPSLGATPDRGAPQLGEHTAAILAEFGLRSSVD